MRIPIYRDNSSSTTLDIILITSKPHDKIESTLLVTYENVYDYYMHQDYLIVKQNDVGSNDIIITPILLERVKKYKAHTVSKK